MVILHTTGSESIQIFLTSRTLIEMNTKYKLSPERWCIMVYNILRDVPANNNFENTNIQPRPYVRAAANVRKLLEGFLENCHSKDQIFEVGSHKVLHKNPDFPFSQHQNLKLSRLSFVGTRVRVLV